MGETTTPEFEIAALSVAEAARYLGLGQSSVWQAIREQRLSARKNGRRTLVLKRDAISFLQELPRAGKQDPSPLKTPRNPR